MSRVRNFHIHVPALGYLNFSFNPVFKHTANPAEFSNAKFPSFQRREIMKCRKIFVLNVFIATFVFTNHITVVSTKSDSDVIFCLQLLS